MRYPLLLGPVYKDYIWGGNTLKASFNKKTLLDPLAESWEFACHKDGTNIILNGPQKGKTLEDYIASVPGVLGEKTKKNNWLPIMVKLIDANDNLSIQVHPNDQYAKLAGAETGKSEMWFILDSKENAEIIYGFKDSITKKEFEYRIKNNSLMEILNRVPVRKGDVFFIEAGTLHAIGKGIVLAEIQQNSNTTYRIYDYNRKGKDGKPRLLHIKDAIEVTNFEKTDNCKIALNRIKKGGYTETLLTRCPYFSSKLINLNKGISSFVSLDSFHHILCVNNNGILSWNETDIILKKGDSLFVPAGCGHYSIKGELEYIITTI